MPISHVSKLFAVVDAKLAKITADPAGGTTTYATSIDVPGIKSMTIDGDITSVELRGDNTSLDFNSVLGGLTIAVEHAKVSLDVLPVLLGGATTDAGTTPSQTATWGLTQANQVFGYFRLEGKTPTNGADPTGGDARFTLYRCVLTSFPTMGLAEENYRTISFEARAVPRLSDGKIIDVVLNETAVALT